MAALPRVALSLAALSASTVRSPALVICELLIHAIASDGCSPSNPSAMSGSPRTASIVLK